MKQFLTNTMLLIAALFLGILLIPISAVTSIIIVFIKNGLTTAFNKLSAYFLAIAMAIDEVGNTTLEFYLNALCRTSDGYPFGNSQETISSALGKNQLKGTLTKTGWFIVNVLNFFEENHCIINIQNNVS